MEPLLTHLDSSFTNFRDFAFTDGGHGYRWVDVKLFRLPSGELSDRDVLAALIAHPQFWDRYDGSGVQEDGPRHHGGWWLDRITPDAYETTDTAKLAEVVDTWAVQHGAVPKALAERLDQEVHEPIRAATSRYLLGELPEEAQHDWIQVHTEFHELVLVDRTTATLRLIVAADD